jgi:RNA polymerase sigma-70 factor (ECF subfamily)
VNCDTATHKTSLIADLIKRAQAGDADAFGALFQAHKARIYSVCLRMTSNAAEAEDLTQDAFLQVFRKITKFRGDSAFSTWVHRIAVNTVLMRFRKKSLSQVSLDEPVNTSNGEKMRREYGTRDKNLAGCIDRIALARAIKKLPSGYRTIFLLHEVEGYEHQEIAEMLSCSVGNSKSQLYKAKMRFRELLAHTPAARLAIRSEQSHNKKRAKPQRESWDLPSFQDAAMPALLRPQLIGQTAFAASGAD